MKTDWTAFAIQTAPSIEPVTTAEVKLVSRIRSTVTTYDTMLANYITAARQAVEKYLGRALITQTLNLYYDNFPCNNEEMILIYSPVRSVSSITYVDTDGVTQTLSASNYRTDLLSITPRITIAYGESWPSIREVTNAIKITYIAGYGDAATDVPAPIKECIKSLCADLFEHPEANLEFKLEQNRTYQFLLNSYMIRNIE